MGKTRPWQVNPEKIAAGAKIRILYCTNNLEIEEAIEKVSAVPEGETILGNFKPFKYDVNYKFLNVSIDVMNTTKKGHLKFLRNRKNGTPDYVSNLIRRVSK